MANLHIAVFAKAPVAGQVKTRLIPLLGDQGAAAVHQQMLLHALQIASAAAPGQVSLWTSGRPDHPFLIACKSRFFAPQFEQINASLGARMAACLRHLSQQHQRVLLIGSDCPVLSVTDLQRADTALRNGAKMVFTPAEDGGYVLVGRRQTVENTSTPQVRQRAAVGELVRPLHDTVEAGYAAFDDIAWSTADVMRQTRERLAAQGWQAGRDWAEMPMRWDVDEPADFLWAVQAGLLSAALAVAK